VKAAYVIITNVPRTSLLLWPRTCLHCVTDWSNFAL